MIWTMLRQTPITITLEVIFMLGLAEHLLFGDHSKPVNPQIQAVQASQNTMQTTAFNYKVPKNAKVIQKDIFPILEVKGIKVHISFCTGSEEARDQYVKKETSDWHAMPSDLCKHLGWTNGKDLLATDESGAFYEQLFWREEQILIIVADLPKGASPETIRKLMPTFGEIASTVRALH